MECVGENCEQEGCYTLVLHLTLEDGQQMSVEVHDQLACERCSRIITIDHYLTDEVKERIRKGLETAGGLPPQFDKAWLEWKPLTDPYIDYLDRRIRALKNASEHSPHLAAACRAKVFALTDAKVKYLEIKGKR